MLFDSKVTKIKYKKCVLDRKRSKNCRALTNVQYFLRERQPCVLLLHTYKKKSSKIWLGLKNRDTCGRYTNNYLDIFINIS